MYDLFSYTNHQCRCIEPRDWTTRKGLHNRLGRDVFRVNSEYDYVFYLLRYLASGGRSIVRLELPGRVFGVRDSAQCIQVCGLSKPRESVVVEEKPIAFDYGGIEGLGNPSANHETPGSHFTSSARQSANPAPDKKPALRKFISKYVFSPVNYIFSHDIWYESEFVYVVPIHIAVEEGGWRCNG